MDIGGYDHIITLKPTPKKAQWLLGLISTSWPEAEICNANSGNETEPLRHFEVKAGTLVPSEWLIYRDPESDASWKKYGRTDENYGWLLHVFFGKTSYTIVSGTDEKSESYKIALDLRSALIANRHTK